MTFFRTLYDKILALSAHPHALWALAIIAFIESSFFPIPPDLLLIPMVLAAPRKAWLYALVCTLASVAGALAGYGIGAFFYETLGSAILDLYAKDSAFGTFKNWYNDWGAWAVLIGGFTPLPYKIITILSGFTGLSLSVFIIASLIARGARFFIVAALLWKFGPPVKRLIERHMGLFSTLFILLLLGGFLALKFIL